MDDDTKVKTATPLADNGTTNIPAPAISTPKILQGVIQRIVGGTAALRVRGAPGRDQQSAAKPLPRPSGYLLSFILLVMLPSLISILYLAFIAANQYAAETRFAVRKAHIDSGTDKVRTALSSLSGGGGIPSLVEQDAYIVTGYIHSQAIVDDLGREMDVRAIFRRPEADFWARLKLNASAEEFLDYWNSMVTTSIDGPSGVVSIFSRAFRPGDTLALSQAIVRASEKLVNEVSARARTDAMRRAEDEMRRSEGLVRAALSDMRAYRDKEGFIDPVSAAASTSQLLLQAMSGKIQLQNEYFVASRAMLPTAPTVQALKSRLDGLDEQIDQLKAKLTGNSPEGKTIAASLVKFEELELKRIFAEKLYSMAQDALERARLKAERQSIFISVFVPPSLPQDARYPERLSLSLLIPLGLLIVWGIIALIAAAVEDHRY